MNERPLDLRQIFRAISRRWLLVLVLFWVGSAGGYLLATRQPPQYTARASVLLPPSRVGSDGEPVRNILTQVRIASNGNILERAGQAVEPPIGVRRMRKLIEVKALTSDILEVQATARSGQDAALLADAVAKEYVAEATNAASGQTSTAISGLQAQEAKLEARLQQTKEEIDAATDRLGTLPPNAAEGVREGALITNLKLEQVEIARQLASLGDKIADARLEDQLNRDATRLLAPAFRPTQPSTPKPAVFTVAGAMLGLLAAFALCLVLDRRDGRIRSRSSIAETVAAPVLASLETPHRVSARAYRIMLERWKPTAQQSWSIRQALIRLSALHGGPPTNIAVVGLPGDMAGPMLALQLAVFGASTGTRTALVVATPHPTADRLRAACHRGARGGEVRSHLVTHTDKVCYREEAHQLTITLVIADPDGSGISGIPSRSMATLGVSSGFTTADTLAATALACHDAGHPLMGALVANPDPSDPTTGDRLGFPSPAGRDQGRASLDSPLLKAMEGGGEPLNGRELDAPQVEGGSARIADRHLGNGRGGSHLDESDPPEAVPQDPPA